ncbi:hypothetical protein [Geodermatophilus chilensis]|uniref:hypothetical protein n=1 Tax=Geodermatophilus chilensis TaxID=2035835 RepID=UPI00130016B4|nr:hypothetical protein [Geodermatophilus chilensis]
MPAYARSTARLCQALVAAVVVSGRAASEVVRAHRVFWWLVASMLTAAADLLTDPDDVLVRRLGVDEHRYRSVPLRLALHRAGRSDEALPHARAAVRLNSPYAPFTTTSAWWRQPWEHHRSQGRTATCAGAQPGVLPAPRC